VTKSQVKIVDGAIKTIGDYAVQISLFTDVTADITLNVAPAV
jgi:ribosomal protein L9